jgi:foldase protein PrsA
MRLLLSAKRFRIGMAFCAAIATAVVLGACGSGVPGGDVAQVGGASITKAMLDHWIVVANEATQASSGTPAPPLPDPPNFTHCVAQEHKQASAAAETTAQLKALCSQSYTSLLNEVMNYLIQAVWIQGEAADKGVSVSHAAVVKAYLAQRKSSTPSLASASALKAFLARSGQTVADLQWRTYLNLLANALELKVSKSAQKVTQAQIAAYYRKNLVSLTTPALRNVQLIETKDAATAATVKGLLAGGANYATLASKYSIDPTTKNIGGKLTGVRPGELNAQLSADIFAAKVGVLSGPFKTAFGYYVLTVTSSTAASVPSLAAATKQIKQAITSEAQSKANAALQADFSKGWTSRTTCAQGYIVPSCGNAPKTSTTSSSTSTVTPAG